MQVLRESRDPWVMKAYMDAAEISEVLGGRGSGICVFILNGKNMRTLGGLFDEFSKVLRFPAYFGRNYDALDECLSDLDWLECHGFLLVFANGDLMLSQESEGLADLIAILDRVGKEWSKPIRVGEEWDRDAVPFHSLFLIQEKTGTLADLPALSF